MDTGIAKAILVAVATFIGINLMGCKTGHGVKCGEGTVLKDGICVVEKVAPKAPDAPKPSAPPAPIVREEPISCEAACMKAASCAGLNVDAPLIAAKCSAECEAVDDEDATLAKDFIDCRQKAKCATIKKCKTAFDKAISKRIREAKEDDPIAITKVRVNTGRYGYSQELTIAYKNQTKRAIDGIKFRYYCRNNFDEPLGTGGLIDQDKLRAGRKTSSVWRIHQDNCTKAKATVTEVHFADGETWTAD